MLSGFQLLETYLPDEKVDIEGIEKKFGFSLPPLYKLFVSTFRLGEKSLKEERYFSSKLNEWYILNYPLYEPLKDDERWFLSIGDFFSIDYVYELWHDHRNGECEWLDYKFLEIAGIGRGGGIYVGTTPKDLDVIYQVVWDDRDYYMKVADNIFEFVKGITMRDVTDEEIFNDYSPSQLYKNYGIAQLYKNYGEDIWRIREKQGKINKLETNIMLSGFQLLETYLPDEKVDIEGIEKKFGFSLPPLYRLFVSTFRLGEKSLKEECFFHPKRKEPYILNYPLYEPLKDDERWFLSIGDFFSIDYVYELWHDHRNGEREWLDYKFLEIAGIGRGVGVYVGTTPKDLDVIYQVIWDDTDYYMKVADNIFEFVKGITMRDVTNEEIFYDYSPSQLYKNYGEDIWRIRENQGKINKLENKCYVKWISIIRDLFTG